MRRSGNEIFTDVDWVTVLLYIVLVTMGWMNIYAAVYNEHHYEITDITQKYGKQMIWIGLSFFIAITLLIINENLYTAFAYGIFAIILLANIFQFSIPKSAQVFANNHFLTLESFVYYRKQLVFPALYLQVHMCVLT